MDLGSQVHIHYTVKNKSVQMEVRDLATCYATVNLKPSGTEANWIGCMDTG